MGSSVICNISVMLVEPFFGDFVPDVKLIPRTAMNRSRDDLVCAVGSAHAAGPTQDQRTSEYRHQDQGRSLDGVTLPRTRSAHQARRHAIVRPPRSRPGQGCLREQMTRIGAPCATDMPRFGRQRAPRPRVRLKGAAERALRAEKLCRLPRVPWKLKDRRGKMGIGPR